MKNTNDDGSKSPTMTCSAEIEKLENVIRRITAKATLASDTDLACELACLKDKIKRLKNACPECREGLVQPRGGPPYCENCGWPDEVRPKPSRKCDLNGKECFNDVCLRGNYCFFVPGSEKH